MYPIGPNKNKDIRTKSIVTFTVPGTNSIGLGIVVETDYTTDTYKVRYIADNNNDWQNFLTNPNREKKIITDNITYNNNEIYNITNTNFRYINDITDENLITNLETLRKLLDP